MSLHSLKLLEFGNMAKLQSDKHKGFKQSDVLVILSEALNLEVKPEVSTLEMLEYVPERFSRHLPCV